MSAAQQQMITREEYQKRLEELYNKNQLMPRVRQFFMERTDVPLAKAMDAAKIPQEFGFDMMAQIAVYKRADVATMIGCLRKHCENDQQVADLLDIAVDKHFLMYETKETPNGVIGTFIVGYDISTELQAELDRYQYPLPMVCEPQEVKTNLDTGYFSEKKTSILLKDNHHKEDVCLDHINRMNKVKLSINMAVATTIQNKWKGLDKKKDDETLDDFKKRRKAFEKYQSVAEGIIGLLVRAGNVLRLTHAYDFRGRTYCRGYHVSYQGAPWNKATLELFDKELIED